MREASRFRANVSPDGVLRVEDRERWSEVLRHLSGRDVEVVIGREVKRRSLSQNAYYWAVVLAHAADWSGNSINECHDAMKELYCQPKPVTLPGGREVMVRSSRLLSVEEFSTFVNLVVEDLRNNRVYVPPAGGVEK